MRRTRWTLWFLIMALATATGCAALDKADTKVENAFNRASIEGRTP